MIKNKLYWEKRKAQMENDFLLIIQKYQKDYSKEIIEEAFKSKLEKGGSRE